MDIRLFTDVFWPSSAKVSQAELDKLKERCEKEQEAASALRNNEQALQRAFEFSLALLASERERSSSVDSRLSGIVSLASVASALVLASVTFLSKKAADLGFVRWTVVVVAVVGAYIAVQFLRAVQAAVKGMARRSVEQDTFLSLVEEDGVAAGYHLVRILHGHANTRRDLSRKIDDKVTWMAVAHRAVLNATVALIVAAVFLCGVTIQRTFVTPKARSGAAASADCE